jgi:AAA+ ATPase superfamily predicted ATPase
MNPFVFNAPVRSSDFFNREKVIKKIIELLFGKAQGDIWLTGERQVGKTSVLQHLENSGDEYAKPFFHYIIKKEMKPVFIYVKEKRGQVCS